MRGKYHWFVCLLAVLALTMCATSARATLTLEAYQPDFVFATSGGSDVNWVIAVDNNPYTIGSVITDSGGHLALVIEDYATIVGTLNLSPVSNQTTTVGSFRVGASVSVSNSPGNAGPPAVAQLQTQSLSVTNLDSVNAHTQYVFVGDTDYTIPIGGMNALSLAQGSGQKAGAGIGAVVGSIHVQTWDDASNTLFGGSAFFPTAGPAYQVQDSPLDILNGLPYSDYGLRTVNLPDPYSKTIEFDITLDPGASLVQRQNTFTNTAVPEPATFVGAIFGLAGLALVARLRRKAS